jgi:hypothetical protein
MKYIYCIALLFCSCKNESKQIPQIIDTDKVEVIPKEKPLFWQEACKLKDFECLYDCNNLNCYQIELYNSPFKDFVVITLDLSDSTKDIVFYNRFKYELQSLENHKKTNKNTNVLKMAFPGSKDTIRYSYPLPKKLIIRPKNKEINTFFTNTIWELPDKDEDIHLLDPEIWTTKARSGNQETELKRHLFKDSIYYINIQNILNICKIKDYKYKTR